MGCQAANLRHSQHLTQPAPDTVELFTQNLASLRPELRDRRPGHKATSAVALLQFRPLRLRLLAISPIARRVKLIREIGQ